MGKHFQLLDFLRRAPKDLLQAYCARHGILDAFDWGPKKKVDAERVSNAIRGCGGDVFAKVAVELRAIADLACKEFTLGVLNEANFHDDDQAYDALFKLTHIGKALWTTLERPEWVANAKVLSDVDKLPDGEYSDGFDVDGVDEPLHIQCLVRIDGGDLTADFTGTSDQVRWPINSVLNYTQAYGTYAVKCLHAGWSSRSRC